MSIASHADGPHSATLDALTLDALFRINVRRQPDALALVDPPDRSAFTDGDVRRLTYADLDRAVSAMAARLRELGLPFGALVALQLPNTVESIVALLGTIRARLVAVPIPLLWRRAETARALNEIGARALVTCNRVGRARHADMALQAAFDTFSIRFVCGFGNALPDGIVPFDDVLDSGGAVSQLNPHEGQPARPTDIVLATFDIGADGPVAAFRTHAQVFAGGLAATLEAGLSRGSLMLSTMLPSSFPVLATTVMPWLLTGGALALHQPFDEAILARQIAEADTPVVVIPGPLAPRLIEAGIALPQSAQILAIWRSPEHQAASAAWSAAARLTDILAFGEVGLVPLRRQAGGSPASLAGGNVHAPVNAADGALIATLRRTSAGTLALGGPMLPARMSTNGTASSLSDAKEIDTGYICREDRTMGTLTLAAPPPGIVRVGGYRFAMRELEDVVGRAEPDGVLAALPDTLAGEKLAGATSDPLAMRHKLDEIGVSPLVSAAFRDRS